MNRVDPAAPESGGGSSVGFGLCRGSLSGPYSLARSRPFGGNFLLFVVLPGLVLPGLLALPTAFPALRQLPPDAGGVQARPVDGSKAPLITSRPAPK